MQRKYDGAYPATAQQARQLYADGYRIAGLYLGGHRAYRTSTVQQFHDQAGAGHALIGYYVGDEPGDPFGYDRGLAHGRESVALARGVGLPLVIVLDIENRATGPAVDAYCHGFADGVVGTEFPRGLYGNPPTIDESGHWFDAIEVADYNNPTNPSTDHIPDVPDDLLIGRRAWQYRGGHAEAGADIDSGVADDWYLGRTAPAAPVPPPSIPTHYPEDNMNSQLVQVELRRDPATGVMGGWFSLASIGLDHPRVTGVNVINETPSAGHYGPVPYYMGKDPSGNGLNFGEVRHGELNDGVYGVEIWSVTG